MINRLYLKGEEARAFIAQNNIKISSYEQSRIEEQTKKFETFNIEGFSKIEFNYYITKYEGSTYQFQFAYPVLIVDGKEYDIYAESNDKYSLQLNTVNGMLRSKLLDYDYVARGLQRPNNIGKATKKKITDWVEYATARHNLMMEAYNKALEKNQNTYKAFEEKYPDLEVSRNEYDGWVKAIYFTKQYEDHDVRYELTAGTDGSFFVNSRIWRTAKIDELLK